MTPKRVTLFAGHYGSGKTNIAVNYAMYLRSLNLPVMIADLDIVNPYFRTKDSEKDLEEKGIELICSRFANSNLDIPALPQEMYKIVQDKSKYAVMDIGGDDSGAVALGRYTPFILEENNYEMVFVANFFRPLTRTPQEAFEVMKEIETAGGIKFTAIINNSNLGNETTVEDILSSKSKINELSVLSALPVMMTTAEKSVCNKAEGKFENLFPLTLQKKYFNINEEVNQCQK